MNLWTVDRSIDEGSTRLVISQTVIAPLDGGWWVGLAAFRHQAGTHHPVQERRDMVKRMGGRVDKDLAIHRTGRRGRGNVEERVVMAGR
ncbi:hypothetical protein BM221_008141 [Beauveria bassiana]|uniref:Uncharacterized protein n=1 Tax=Beauveria bassiana TaxID=176275 RepID=A0A2N6NFB2_BEABA|nr:hypothetical protein BM221_008141 [Beauveria bassiana]